MKRTTMMLHDRRLIDLKRLAAERGQTISAAVDQLLADGIRRAALPVFEMGEPRVNLADRGQLF
jgi:hypothetical protein